MIKSKTSSNDQKGICNSNVVAGIVLPMCKSHATTRLPVLEAIVATTPGLSRYPQSLHFQILACKTFEYCQDPSIAAYQKRLDNLTLAELKDCSMYVSTACSTQEETALSVADGFDSREKICDLLMKAFVKNNLQEYFKAALRAGNVEAVDEVLEAWNIDSCGPSLNEKILAAAEGLNLERWAQVSDWVLQYYEPIQGRTKSGIKKVLEKNDKMIQECKLQVGEVLAAYLYTGPGFAAYNSVYRKHPPQLVKVLQGDAAWSDNTMSTTLFCISSALLKLSRHTPIPNDCKLYRGLGEMLLPLQFWVEHGEPPWKGGVEMAFMSTTSDKDTAVKYVRGKGMVAEINVGRIQIGGDLNWVSMVRTYIMTVSRITGS